MAPKRSICGTISDHCTRTTTNPALARLCVKRTLEELLSSDQLDAVRAEMVVEADFYVSFYSYIHGALPSLIMAELNCPL